jgi:perosamine synthetase
MKFPNRSFVVSMVFGLKPHELTRPRVPYSCIYFDAGWGEALYLVRQILTTLSWNNNQPHIQSAQQRIAQYFDSNPSATASPQAMVTLSVRTALDLYLTIMNFPEGSEFVLTAINIPDMVRVVREHKLIPVPIDIDMNTLAPNLKQLKEAINEKTCCLLIAHIYNRRNDISEAIKIAKTARPGRPVPVLEDCAEAFAHNFTGNPESDLVFFSFGSIKICTAFGGGVVKVADKAIFDKMQALYAKSSIRPRDEILQKMIKYMFVMFFMNSPSRSSTIIAVLEFLGIDHRELTVSLLRGFPNQFFEKLRQRPCPSLISTLDWRLQNYKTDAEIAKNTQHCEFVRKQLPLGAALPGMEAKNVDYWLFPVVVQHPDLTLKKLDAKGMDAYRGATQLRLLEPPSEKEVGRKIEVAQNAKFIMDHVIYLPVHKNVPFEGLQQIVDLLRDSLQEIENEKVANRPPKAKL